MECHGNALQAGEHDLTQTAENLALQTSGQEIPQEPHQDGHGNGSRYHSQEKMKEVTVLFDEDAINKKSYAEGNETGETSLCEQGKENRASCQGWRIRERRLNFGLNIRSSLIRPPPQRSV
jgi:hypothetical protein